MFGTFLDWKRSALIIFVLLIGTSAFTLAFSCAGNQVCIQTGFKAASGVRSGTLSRSDFSCPVDGLIQSGINPGELRQGVELSVAMGTPVRAAADGIVSRSAYDGSGLGYFVEILHAENPRMETRYGYLSHSAVRENERVRKGDVIGQSGQSGQSHSPALYFEVRKDGSYSRESESLCRFASQEPTQIVTSKPQPKPVSSTDKFDVSSRAAFSPSSVQVLRVSECVAQAESACPPTGTASFRGRSWKTADRFCIFRKASVIYQVPYSLLYALLIQESGGNQFAVSGADASGYTQMLPSTAQGLGVGADKLFDPYYNICGGVTYLAAQLKKSGSVECALAAYNAGPYDREVLTRDPNVCRNHRISETRNYVRSITAKWERDIGVA